MPESDSPVLMVVLIGLLVGQVVLVGVVVGVRRSLGRIERRLAGRQGGDGRAGEEAGANRAEPAPDGAFDEFLREDPTRRELTKGEQFAAFRTWRREKGLNWSNRE